MFFFFFFFPNLFSERLAHAMEKQNMDAKSLATLTDVSPTTVRRWLNGTYEPRHINLPKVARVLNVSADYLCGIES
ncbi:helix-turn-helix domain-containing protein [Anaerotignum sp.]